MSPTVAPSWHLSWRILSIISINSTADIVSLTRVCYVTVTFQKKEELFFVDVLGIEKDNKLLWIHSFDTKTPCSHQNHKCLNLRVAFMLEFNSPHNFLHLRQMRVEVRILVLPRQARRHTIAKNSTLNECQNPGSTTNQPETEASTHLCPETDNMLTCLTTSPMLAGTSLSVI